MWKEGCSPTSTTHLGFHIAIAACRVESEISVTAADIASVGSWSSGRPTWKDSSADKRVPHVQSQALDFRSLLPSPQEGERTHLPRRPCGLDEIMYLESTPGAAEGVSGVRYI